MISRFLGLVSLTRGAGPPGAMTDVGVFNRTFASALGHRGTDPYVLDPPAATAADLTLRIAAPGRFGNYVAQLITAIHVARTIGAARICAFDTDVIRCSGRGSVQGLEFWPDEITGTPVLTGSFFDRSAFGSLMDSLTSGCQIEIAQTFIRGMIEAEPPPVRLGRRDLVINIRAGDIFDSRNFINWSPGTGIEDYPQPPLAFYTSLVETVFAGAPDSVWILAEDMSNPVTLPLLAFLRDRHIPVVLRASQPLKQDLGIMLAAKTLVLANGTFGHAVTMLSPSLERLFHFRRSTSARIDIGTYVPNNVVAHIADVDEGSYINIGDWRNSDAQNELMLQLEAKNLRWSTVA